MSSESEIAIGLKTEEKTNLEEVIVTLDQKIKEARKLAPEDHVPALQEAVKEAIDQVPRNLLFKTWNCGSIDLIATFVDFANKPGQGSYLLSHSGELFVTRGDYRSSSLVRARDEDWLKLDKAFLRPFEIAQMRASYIKPESQES